MTGRAARRPVLVRWLWRAVALVAGALGSLIFPAANLWWFAYFAFVPVVVLVALATDRRDAVWRAWAAGTGFFVGLFHWLLWVLGPFVPIPTLAMGATWIPIGLAVWATLGRRAAHVPQRTITQMAVAVGLVPSVWVLIETLRSWDVFGGSWGLVGLSQWQVPPVLGVAALGGVWAISWLVVAVNVGIAAAVLANGAPSARVTALALPAVVFAIAVGAAQVRSAPEVVHHFRVAAVQPGLIHDGEERLRANEMLTLDVLPEHLAATGREVDLVVWGQSSVAFDPETDAAVRDRLEAIAAAVDRPVLVNVDARRPDGRIAKSSVLIDPVDGIVDSYDKQRLVPFGEYIPLRPIFGWVAQFTDAAAEDRVPGGELTVLEVDGTIVGPLISYESTFADMRRSVVRLGAEVVVVQAASTTFQGSWAQPQQASFEAVRAVESGRSSVLVAVSGTTSAFDASGRKLAWFAADRTGIVLVDLPVSRTETPYVRWGDWVVWLSAVVVVVFVANEVRRRFAKGTSP